MFCGKELKMKNKKILKILLIIIVILFFILGCYTIYKFVIIQKIFYKMNEYVSVNNYYMKIRDLEDASIQTEVYYKDGIGKMITETGIYSWTDGKEAYLINDESKEIQSIDFDSPLLISNEYVGSMIPGYSKNILQKLLLAGNMETSVKVQKSNGVKYYVISTNESFEKTIWFGYNTLLPSQINAKIGEFKTSYGYEITFGKVKNEDIEKPNIEEYTLVEKTETEEE